MTELPPEDSASQTSVSSRARRVLHEWADSKGIPQLPRRGVWIGIAIVVLLAVGVVAFFADLSTIADSRTFGWVLGRSPTDASTGDSSNSEEPVDPNPRTPPDVLFVGPEEGDPAVDWLPALATLRTEWDASGQASPLANLKHLALNDRGITYAARTARFICTRDTYKGVIAVIGYVWTDAAHAALDAFDEYCNGDPPPVFLIGATEDVLTERNDPTYAFPVLQMAPSNLYQAKAIAEAIGVTYPAPAKPRIKLVRSNDNSTYSNNLATAIQEVIAAYNGPDPIWDSVVYQNEPWTELVRVPNGNGDTVDILVLIGNSSAFTDLLRQRPPGQTAPVTIVTDGSVNGDLLSIPGARCVWGTFPAKGDVPGRRAPSFGPIARTALRLLESLLRRVEARGVPASRGALREEVTQLVTTNSQIVLDTGSLRFDARGRLAEVRDSKFDVFADLYHFHLLSPTKDGTLAWHHRTRRVSLGRCEVPAPR